MALHEAIPSSLPLDPSNRWSIYAGQRICWAFR